MSKTPHQIHMTRCLKLADLSQGRTSPNPAVGAVIVKDNKIVGEGRTQQPGGNHAEVEAILKAGKNCHGAVLYCTLEPCCHTGKTPPCTDAIISAGIKKVIYANPDPNPLVNGKGHFILEQSGILVRSGVLSELGKKQNQAYFKHCSTGLPLVTAKFAMSLDGKIATSSGQSKWISSKTSRNHAHDIREKTDAIMIGVGTAISDDPRLTVRKNQTDTKNPIRVVADSLARIPLNAKLVNNELKGTTIIAVTESADQTKVEALVEQGNLVWTIQSSNGRINLNTLLQKLGNYDVLNVIVEGGGTLLGSFLEEKLIDRICAYIAPQIIGGTSAPTPFGGAGIGELSETLKLQNVEYKTLDKDICIEADVQDNS